jgi:hypothetical protein
VAQVLCQLRRYQQLYSILPDCLIFRDIPPPANVGINRYLNGGTGSRGEANQVYGGPPTFLLDMPYGFIADSYLHGLNLFRAYSAFIDSNSCSRLNLKT